MELKTMKRLILATIIFMILCITVIPAEAAESKTGDKIGEFMGVPAYSNGGNINGPYQCVEYIKRFYRDAMGTDTSQWHGNAVTYYTEAKSKRLVSYSNDGTTPPQAGDILVWSGGKEGYGHVAIIAAVSDNVIDIVEQNWNRNAAYVQLKRTGNYIPDRVSRTKNGVEIYHVEGWCRLAPSPLPYSNIKDTSIEGNPIDQVWVGTIFLGPLGTPDAYGCDGSQRYHLNGAFEFQVNDGKKCISLKDSTSYFPNGLYAWVHEAHAWNFMCTNSINLKQGVYDKLNINKRENLNVDVYKDNIKFGTRQLAYQEPSIVKLDSSSVINDKYGKYIKTVLNYDKKNYLFQDAVFILIKDSNGIEIKRSYCFQPKFNNDGKYICPVITIDNDFTGDATVQIYDIALTEGYYSNAYNKVDECKISM